MRFILKRSTVLMRLVLVAALTAGGLVVAGAAPAQASTIKTNWKKTKVLKSTSTRYVKLTLADQWDVGNHRYRAVGWLDCYYKGKRTACSVGTLGINLYWYDKDGDGNVHRVKYNYDYIKSVGKDGHYRIRTGWFTHTHETLLHVHAYVSDLGVKGKHYYTSKPWSGSNIAGYGAQYLY